MLPSSLLGTFLSAGVTGIVAPGALGKAVLRLSDMPAPIEGMSKLARNAREYGRSIMSSKHALGTAGSARAGGLGHSPVSAVRVRHRIGLSHNLFAMLDMLEPTRPSCIMNGISAGDYPSRFLRDDGRRTATTNERVLLDLLSRQGPASRADLARLTGLAPHSITRLVEPLLSRGLIAEGVPVAQGRGKPSSALRLVGSAAFSIGLSVMTDAVSLTLLDLAGTIAATHTERLEDTAITPACRQIGRLIDKAVAEAGWDRGALVGIGVGVTGYFIGSGARLNPPQLLDPWALVPLDTILAEAFGAKVWVDNDGNVAAIGEDMLGHGRTTRDFAYLYFSAGFGGGVVATGRSLRGRHGNAGEFASILPIDWPQPNLETLRHSFVETGLAFPDIQAMLVGFDPHHPAVDRWLDTVMPSLNLVASAISATLDPGMIVLGGRIPPALAQRIVGRISFTNPERRGFHRPAPQIVVSAVGDDATAIGAATLPLRAAFFDRDGGAER